MNSPQADFVAAHLESDLHRLLLNARQYPGIDVAAAVAQISALRKIKSKVPDWYNTELLFPPALSLEQASSAATAQFKAALFNGKRMADLSGGMGIDAYFWAKSFQTVHYVEQNETLAALAKHNFAVLGQTNVEVHSTDAASFLGSVTDRFDLLYIDPARRDEAQRKVFRLEDCRPDILALKPLLFERSAAVLIKTAPLLDLKEASRQLGHVATIWVVAAGNEVKEVLYLLRPDAGAAPDIHAVRIESATTRLFSFNWATEHSAAPAYGLPAQYLYEPDAAILKAGGFKSFATQFDLQKLHVHTHLYTAAEHQPGLPARAFRVLSVCKYDKKAVLAQLTAAKANIACRNFPDSVELVRKKLGLAEGGDQYLFAATLVDGAKVVLVCEKV